MSAIEQVKIWVAANPWVESTAVVGLIGVLFTLLMNRYIAGINIGMQRLTTARSAAMFIGDKRQDWIDELRSDIARYLSLTQELAEGYKLLFWKMGDYYDRFSHMDALDVIDTCAQWRNSHHEQTAKLDSEHHQLLIRIVLRLNNEEDAHQGLMQTLHELRECILSLANLAAKDRHPERSVYAKMVETIDLAAGYAKVILREEWVKLKREVADPEKLIKEIISIKPRSKHAVDLAAKAKPLSSVASSLTAEYPTFPEPKP